MGNWNCLNREVVEVEPDEGFGHSFCYVHPPNPTTCLSSTTNFGSLSGASVSANTWTNSLTEYKEYSSTAAAFDCSDSFSSVPLQPIPRRSFSGPLYGVFERGFLSGPIERGGFLSGPLSLEQKGGTFSGQVERKSKLFGGVGKSSSKKRSKNIQWAQGKAGEDRVHVVISEKHGWTFVGIYDGFNGPDAPDYLVSSLYPAVERELEGLLWESAKLRHVDVLNALSEGLKNAENEYLDVADNMVSENPELALMGSCVLVMLMKDDDVYLMNVGDSRGVVGRKQPLWHNDNNSDNDNSDDDDGFPRLAAVQLTLDHSTCVEEEVERIRQEHPDDALAVRNDRVKGSLKVTRAFGAGFLKQPKWNDALLEVFRIDYVGSSPYITCIPSLIHHRLSSRDRLLILSSDGLYEYLTNQEAVAEVELFMSMYPEGDPAQHLVEEVIFRAATKAGMDFHELLQIPQGDRRRYHDDVSIIVISFHGRIWRSCL